MSVIGSAGEAPDSPRVHLAYEDGITVRSYTRKFTVNCSTVADGGNVVLSAPGLPLLYSPYVFGSDNDTYALARSINAERKMAGTASWTVTVEYKTPSKQEILGQFDNPLLELPSVETSCERFQEVVYAVYDLATQSLTPCKASNGQVFDPPPMKDASRLILTISRNESVSVLHPAADIIYQDATNLDVFWGLPAGTWKCQSITTKREQRQTSNYGVVYYLKCTYKFEARPTWNTRILDAGSFYIDSGTGKRFQFLTDDGHPTVGPLDGNGGKLAPGANPVFNVFQFYPRQPFAPLNLPQSFASVT